MTSARLPILGAGESGVGAARLALLNGFQPWVSDAGEGVLAMREELDKHSIDHEFNGHSNDAILESSKSVGLGYQKPWNSRNCSTH